MVDALSQLLSLLSYNEGGNILYTELIEVWWMCKLKEVEKREKEEVVTCGVCVGVVDKLVLVGATGTTENTEKTHFQPQLLA